MSVSQMQSQSLVGSILGAVASTSAAGTTPAVAPEPCQVVARIPGPPGAGQISCRDVAAGLQLALASGALALPGAATENPESVPVGVMPLGWGCRRTSLVCEVLDVEASLTARQGRVGSKAFANGPRTCTRPSCPTGHSTPSTPRRTCPHFPLPTLGSSSACPSTIGWSLGTMCGDMQNPAR